MNTSCNDSSAASDPAPETEHESSVAGANGAPFSARSLALSLLLGSHPPRLSTSVLVASGSLFGINAGTMRTALSRMAATGEVAPTTSGYELAGSLIERQRRQDSGRRSAGSEWDGRWWSVTPRYSARELADRRELRRRLQRAGFGELRPDYWLRPANRDTSDLGPDLIVTIGDLLVDDIEALVGELWPLPDLAVEADGLLSEAGRLTAREADLVGGADPGPQLGTWLVETFTASADIVRFLTREPRLPPSLVPHPWAPDELRHRYNDLEQLFQRHLARFLRSQQANATNRASPDPGRAPTNPAGAENPR